MSTFTGQVYGNGTNSTSGANVRTDFYDRAAIKVAVDDLIDEQVLIKEIVREGVVLEFNEHVFLVPIL